MDVNTLLVPLVAIWLMFEAGRSMWGWLKKSRPAPPPPPPERTLTTKDLEDILDMFIQYQGSVVTDVRTVQAPPVAIKEEEHNGHRELTEDDVLANLNPRQTMAQIGLQVIEPEPKQPAKGKKRGKK